MKKLTVWQNVDFEGPSVILNWAKCMKIEVDIVHAYDNEEPRTSDLLVVLGGPMSVYDGVDYLEKEKIVLANHIAKGGKVFGICLGAQLIASVLGANVYAGEQREAGWRSVDFEPSGLFGDFPSCMRVFHWHGDTFDLPTNATRFASNDAYQNQAFYAHDGRVVATQFHLEFTENSIEFLLLSDSEYLVSDSPFVDSAQDIQSECTNVKGANKLLFDLLDRWSES